MDSWRDRDSFRGRLERNGFKVASYIRIASLAVATYDFLLTQPTAWRFYREHWRSRRLTISVVLFFLLQVTSITVLVISSVGFFYDGFTLETCSHYYLLPPIFKVVQVMVSQAILAVRAFNLSRRSKYVGYFMVAAFLSACTLQWLTTMFNRSPSLGKRQNNCRAASNSPLLGAWIFYAVAIGYDVLTTAMSIWFLVRYKLNSKNSLVSQLTRMMLYDGLGYLFVLTAVNVLNALLFLEREEVQTAGASLGYTLGWIMSQRLLINLYDASREHRDDESFGALTLSKHITGHRDINRAVRSQFDNKNADPFDLGGRRNRDSVSSAGLPDDLNVSVRIERTVKMGRVTRTIELEDYSRRSRPDQLGSQLGSRL